MLLKGFLFILFLAAIAGLLLFIFRDQLERFSFQMDVDDELDEEEQRGKEEES